MLAALIEDTQNIHCSSWCKNTFFIIHGSYQIWANLTLGCCDEREFHPASCLLWPGVVHSVFVIVKDSIPNTQSTEGRHGSLMSGWNPLGAAALIRRGRPTLWTQCLVEPALCELHVAFMSLTKQASVPERSRSDGLFHEGWHPWAVCCL